MDLTGPELIFRGGWDVMTRVARMTVIIGGVEVVGFVISSMCGRPHIPFIDSLGFSQIKCSVDRTCSKSEIEHFGRNARIADDPTVARVPSSPLFKESDSLPTRSKISSCLMPKEPLFISRLYSYRVLEPISQFELAKELGIRRQTLAAIEKGAAQPSLLTAFRIAQYFKTPIENLFSFKERP